MKTKFYISIFCLSFLILSGSKNLSAATVTWVNGSTGGLWTDTANWGGVIPMANDDVQINPTTAITITGTPAISLNSLTIGGTIGGSVTLQSSAASNVTIVDGALATDLSVATGISLILDNTITLIATTTGSVGTISGTLKVMGASVFTTSATVTTFASGSTYEHATATNTVAAATYASGSLIRITGMTTMSTFTNNQLTSLPASIGGSLEWNCPNQSGATGIWLPGGAGSTLNIGEDLTIISTGSSALTQGAVSGRSAVVGRNYFMQGGTQNIAGGGTTYSASGTFALTVNGNATISGGNLIILGSGNPNPVNGISSFNVTGSTTINGGTLTFTAATSGVGGMNFNLGGNLVHSSGTITCSAANMPASITFNGIANQTISTIGFSGAGAYNMTVNNSAGIKLNSDLTVTGTLTMTAGNIDVTTKNLILGSASPAITGSPFSATNMIIADGGGTVMKQATTAAQASYMFPIGDNTGTAEYSPVTLTFTGGTYTGASVSVKVTNANHPNNTIGIAYINRYWTIGQTGISGFSATVAATYTDADIVGNEANILMGQWNGIAPWTLYPTSLNAANNILTATGVTTLPSDFSGIFDYITSTKENLQSNSFSIFPNPAHDYLILKNGSLNKDVSLQIINSTGQVVQDQKLNVQAERKVDLNLSSGLYFLRVSDGEKIYSGKLTIE